MAKYVCNRCGYPTNKKSHFDKHINANSCTEGKLNSRVKNVSNLVKSDNNTITDDIKSSIDEINKSEKKFMCPSCNKGFNRKFNYNRHYHDVHVKKINKNSDKMTHCTNGQDGHNNAMTNMAQCYNPTISKSHNTKTDSHDTLIDSQNTIMLGHKCCKNLTYFLRCFDSFFFQFLYDSQYL